MQVQEIAQMTGVTAETVRYYSRIGLLRPEQNPHNGYRRYRVQDVENLKFIRNARDLGFTVKDIQEILAQSQRGESPCPMVRELIVNRIHELELKMAREQKLLDRMRGAIKIWETLPDSIPNGHIICKLIENVSQAEIHPDSPEKNR